MISETIDVAGGAGGTSGGAGGTGRSNLFPVTVTITLRYESHNGHEREAARLVAEKYPEARIVDVSTWTAMRDTPSEKGWPDRHVRAFPCLVFDSNDGEVELERVEEILTKEVVEEREALAKANGKRVKSALAEARQRNDVSGGARPILLSELRPVGEASHSSGVVTIEGSAEAETVPVASKRATSQRTPKKK